MHGGVSRSEADKRASVSEFGRVWAFQGVLGVNRSYAALGRRVRGSLAAARPRGTCGTSSGFALLYVAVWCQEARVLGSEGKHASGEARAPRGLRCLGVWLAAPAFCCSGSFPSDGVVGLSCCCKGIVGPSPGFAGVCSMEPEHAGPLPVRPSCSLMVIVALIRSFRQQAGWYLSRMPTALPWYSLLSMPVARGSPC